MHIPDKPETIYEGTTKRMKPLYGIIIALICLSPIGLLATGTAWVEWSTNEIKKVISKGSELGYVPDGMKNSFRLQGIMPDYSVFGLLDKFGYILSAIAGVALLLIVFKILASFKGNENLRDESGGGE